MITKISMVQITLLSNASERKYQVGNCDGDNTIYNKLNINQNIAKFVQYLIT